MSRALDVRATGLRVPPDWVCHAVHSELGPGAHLVAAPDHPVRPGDVPPRLSVRATAIRAGAEVWLADLLAGLRQEPGFDVEDEDLIDLGGQDVGYLRYAHRARGAGGIGSATELLSERWSWWREGLGLTLTGTLAREDYELWCDVFESVAATVDATRLRAAA